MATKDRLYYDDAYRTTFQASVIERLDWEGRPALILEGTVFYPTSGGQPADRGTLNGVPVLDVQVDEAGDRIIHVLGAPVDAEQVVGELDWPRRFDHMQQHTGQHILSAAFEQLLDVETVGFHLGSEASTIDVDRADLGLEAIEAVEALANRMLFADAAVTCRFVKRGELADLPLRKPPTVDGPVRIVEVDGFDVNPCGGTHVGRTGEIGLVKITNTERRGDATRVEFLCGQRALEDYRVKHQTLSELAAMLSVGYWDLEQAIVRLQDENKEARRRLRAAEDLLLDHRAAQLASDAIALPSGSLIASVEESAEISKLQALARLLTRQPGTIALLVGIGERTGICLAAADGLDVDLRPTFRLLCERLEGKGGGHPTFIQGSAEVIDPNRVRAALDEASAAVESLGDSLV